MIFDQLSMVVILFFKMRAKFCRHVCLATNIPCNFGQDIFINEYEILRLMKKHDEWAHGRTHVQKAFYNLPTMAFGCSREMNMTHQKVTLTRGSDF